MNNVRKKKINSKAKNKTQPKDKVFRIKCSYINYYVKCISKLNEDDTNFYELY